MGRPDSATAPAVSPSTSDPATLTVSVPHGNTLSWRDWIDQVDHVAKRRPEGAAGQHEEDRHPVPSG